MSSPSVHLLEDESGQNRPADLDDRNVTRARAQVTLDSILSLRNKTTGGGEIDGGAPSPSLFNAPPSTTATSSTSSLTSYKHKMMMNNNNNNIQLCASCDRCRSRKTKCDGKRPCSNCKTRYLRANNTRAAAGNGGFDVNIDHIDISEFDCVYSPAKRRGPIPGKSSQSRGGGAGNLRHQQQQQQHQQQFQQQQQQQQPSYQQYIMSSPSPSSNNNDSNDNLFMNPGFDNLNINTVSGGSNNNGGGGGGMFQQSMNNNVNNMNNGGRVGGGGADVSNQMFNQLNQQLNNNNNDSTGATEQMKQMLLLQQQLVLQQQQLQQQQQQQLLAQQLAAQLGQQGGGGGGGLQQGGGGGGLAVDNSALQLLQQYQSNATTQQQQQQQQQPNQPVPQQQLQQTYQQQQVNLNPVSVLSAQPQQQQQQPFYEDLTSNSAVGGGGGGITHHHQPPQSQDDMSRSAKRTAPSVSDNNNSSSNSNNNNAISSVVNNLLPLLEPTSPSGSLLRQYYELSTNNIFNLPPIPSNELYCAKLIDIGIPCHSPSDIPLYDQSALNAARFSELALGALADDQLNLALELGNACVLCLRNCTEEPTDKSCISFVARAYLLYGILRSLRGDMVHYFKYRRVCMTHIYMLDGQDENIDALLAAMSFHDAFAYMMYNAIEEALPDIDQVLPPINTKANAAASTTNVTSNDAPTASFGCRQVTNPINQMWIQGEPSIFLKNEARIVHRSLDAMSCAVRSCCDQANREFSEMAKAMGGGGEGGDGPPSGDFACGATPTSLAVMANEDEMCSRNLILSAKTLVNQGNTGEPVSKPGLTMMLTAMDAFLENSGPQGSSDSDGGGGSSSGGGEEGGFSETQIRNLLMSCEMAIKHPMLLYAPGPVYHMMSNAAVLLCHLLNGLHAKCSMMSGDSSNGSSGEEVESAMFYETLDTFMSLRKLLNMRRQHLPVRLRCHAIPRPNSNFGLSKKNTEPEAPFIDLGETLMCSCRGCQGFVLMGCSPCVAAERSMRSAKVQASELEGDDDINEYDDLGELNLDDDTLLNILSRIASN